MSSAPASKIRRTKPSGGPVTKTTTRHVGALLDRTFDQEEDAVGIARARDDEEVRRRLLQGRPALVEAVDDAHDLDLSAMCGQRRLDECVIDSLVYGYQCANGLGHSWPPCADLLVRPSRSARRRARSRSRRCPGWPQSAFDASAEASPRGPRCRRRTRRQPRPGRSSGASASSWSSRCSHRSSCCWMDCRAPERLARAA